MVDEKRLLQTFLDLVQMDSPSREEGAIALDLANRLRRLGLSVAVDGMHSIFATLPGQGEPLLLMAHSDTVMPGRGVKPQVDNGVICSDGSTVLGSDDKSGVAVILETLQVVVEQGLAHPPIEVVITAQEEIGLVGAKQLDKSKLTARYGLSYDYGGDPGTIVVSAPAYNRFWAVVHGKAAHAGVNPEDGISAIVVAAEAITQMRLGRIDDRTAANVGVIRGGTARSTIPDRVEMEGVVWSLYPERLQEHTEAVTEALQRAAARHGAAVDIEVNHVCNGYSFDESSRMVAMLLDACQELGLRAVLGFNGGVTDVNVILDEVQGLEIVSPTTGMSKVHTTEECIRLRDMANCVRMTLHCVRQMAA